MTPNKDIRAFKVFAIEAGTVIDHIDAGQALKIINILNLTSENRVVTAGFNFPSSKLGTKDIIKVEHRVLTQDEANRVAIFAPHASINIIENYEVSKKFSIHIPETIEKLIICPNPNCITNHDRMDSFFFVKQNGHGLEFKCKYCEKLFAREDILHYAN